MRTWTILLSTIAGLLLVPAVRRRALGGVLRQPWMRRSAMRAAMALPRTRRMRARNMVRPLTRILTR